MYGRSNPKEMYEGSNPKEKYRRNNPKEMYERSNSKLLGKKILQQRIKVRNNPKSMIRNGECRIKKGVLAAIINDPTYHLSFD